MADSDPVVTTRGDMRRLMNAARRIEKTPLRERGRTAKGPIPEDAEDTSTGTTTTGSCCCDELDCLRITGYTGEITPLYYSFTLSTFVCDCAGDAESDEVRLYQADSEDDTVWESEPIRCTAPADAEVEPVVVTSTWAWNVAEARWDFVSTDVEDAECEPEEPDYTPEDPEEEDVTAETTCETSYVDYFWRLTIAEELDENGCDTSTLVWGYELPA